MSFSSYWHKMLSSFRELEGSGLGGLLVPLVLCFAESIRSTNTRTSSQYSEA